MIRVGLVGVGGTVSIARTHLSAYLKDERVRVTALYNRSFDRAAKFLQEYGLDAKICESYEELLSEVDAVDICTPNYTHFGFAKAAMEAGKHLLLEKPLSINFLEAEVLNEVSKKHKGVHMVGFCYRYASAISLAKKILSENFDKVYTINCLFGGKRLANPALPMEWRFRRDQSGSGAVGDFGSHLLDILRYLTGEEFSQARMFSETFIKKRISDGEEADVENDDASALILRSENTIATILVSRVGAPDMKIFLAGDGGILDISLGRPNRIEYHKKSRFGPYTGEILVQEYSEDNALWIERQIRDFIDCIVGEKKEYATIADGHYVQKVLALAETNQV